MKQVSVNLYRLEELPEKTRSRVINTWRDGDSPYFADEFTETLHTMEKALNCRVVDWQYDSYSYNYRLTGNDADFTRPAYRIVTDIMGDLLKSSGRKVYYRNNGKRRVSRIIASCYCPFTGVYYDCAFTDAVKELHRPGNFYTWTYQDFCRLVFNNLFDMGVKSYADWLSEDSVREDIEANDYWFTANGAVWHG